MSGNRFAVLAVACALILVLSVHVGHSWAAEFSDEATALPIPPDARELEYVAWAGDINYRSSSPLKSLAAFYLKGMAQRGWKLDKSDSEIEEDSIVLLFRHGEAEAELDLSQWSKEVHVTIDCTGLKFSDANDPAKLAAAGIPVPRAALFLQKEIALPDDVQKLRYDGDGCEFKTSMKLAKAFEDFSGQVKGKGFRESRRPIVTDTRRYTEFKKGSAEMSVNVFADPVGSRVVLEYANPREEKPVRPLPVVASLQLDDPQGGGESAAEESTDDEPGEAPEAGKPINVADNKGSATVTYRGKKYTFNNVACFQNKDIGSYATMAVFSAKPIPYAKMQAAVAKEDDFSFGDLYDFDLPNHLVLHLGKHPNFSLSLPGVGMGQPIKDAVNELKVETGRVRGTLKMPPVEILDSPLSFATTLDAAIIKPDTRIAGPGAPAARPDGPMSADSSVPMPKGADNVVQKGSKFRKTKSAVVDSPLAEVASFYRRELAAKGWKQIDGKDRDAAMRFKKDAMDLSLVLKRQNDETAIEIATRDSALAKREGVLPEPGKGRLVLANAGNVGVVFTIGKTEYPLGAGRGAKEFKQALNYSVPPGTYKVVVKIPGQQPQTERIRLTEGSTWAIIALPTGGYMPMRLY